MKAWIKVLIGLGIVVSGILVFAFMRNSREEAVDQVVREQKMVSTSLAAPTSLPFVIEATGAISAKRRIELYSEVQGVLLATKTDFKEGNAFRKNQTILQINDSEYKAQLLSSRSSFMNKIAGMLPDMEVEFPSSAKNWLSYLKGFDVNQSLGNLPSTKSDSERFFLTGRGVYESFYTVKNQEERLSKYRLKAPFDGIVTESLVTEGTLVRSGQKLGEYIDPSVFEIKLEVPAQYDNYVELGKKVLLRTLDNTREFEGKISRINGSINTDTQTIIMVAEIADKSLKQGQFLKAIIFGDMMHKVVKINSNLLVENNQVYVVKDSVLYLQKVIPLNYVGDSVVVQGLETNTVLVDVALANAYPGLKVFF